MQAARGTVDDERPCCGVCFHGYQEQGERQPLILECGHTLCKTCTQTAGLISCPICRKPFSRSLRTIPPNYALMQTLVPATSGPGAVRTFLQRWNMVAAERLLLSPEHLVLGDVIKRGASALMRKGTLQGRQVVAKVLNLPHTGTAVDSLQLSALKRELAVLLHITETCHHVCRYLGITCKGEDFCIVMPLYPDNLSDYIRQQGSAGLPLPRALEIARDIALGLEELHGQGVVVLDLKPENVLLTAQGTAVLCDFGLSKVLNRACGASSSSVTQVAGTTFNYMSPEQMEEGSAVSYKADVWAFACTLIHMVTGQVPMAGLNLMQILRKVCVSKEATKLPHGLPEQLTQLLSSCLKFDSNDRPTAPEISKALKTIPRPLDQRAEKSAGKRALPAATAGEHGGSKRLQLSQELGGSGGLGGGGGGTVGPAVDTSRLIIFRDQCAQVIQFEVKLYTPFAKMFRAYAAYASKKGIRNSVRFLLDGKRIEGHDTASSLGLEDGDKVDVVVDQIGDIGQWEAAAGVPGTGSLVPSEQLLLLGAAASPLSPAQVNDIIRTARGPPPPRSLLPPLLCSPEVSSGGVEPLSDLLSGSQCTALMSHMDAQLRSFCADNPGGLQLFDGQQGFAPKDFKLALPRPALDGLVSPPVSAAMEACGQKLLSRLGIPPAATALRFLLRRRAFTPTSGPPERIPFHRDHSLVVVNVALNTSFQGGSLMFLIDGRVVCPPRPEGCGTAHDCTTVHGVSQLTAGVRYNLFAVFDAAQAA